MAPEYFPRLCFFATAVSDGDFVLDPGRPYEKQSYLNRARLRTPDGWQWITVPVIGRQVGIPVRDVEIDNTVPWRKKHLRAFQYNYRSTPYFEAFEDRIVEFFDKEWRLLGDATVASVELTCELLGLRGPIPSSGRLGDSGSKRTIPESVSKIRYRQNFEGFEAGMSVLDAFFNLGYETTELIRKASALIG